MTSAVEVMKSRREMMLLVNGWKPILADPDFSPHVGHLTSPCSGLRLSLLASTGLFNAMDNDCFSTFNDNRFRRGVSVLKDDTPAGFLFATAPDVVADARATLLRFGDWVDFIKPLPVALVGQDGMEDMDASREMAACDAFFVGGSTEWKLSKAAADLVGEARSLGKLVHMGRVNSFRRMRIAYDLGCHTIDGTKYSKYTRTHLANAVGFLAGLALRPRACDATVRYVTKSMFS